MATATIPRIEANEVQQKKQVGSDLLLVCAYYGDDKFQQFHLDGAISLSNFKAIEPTIATEREIVFYCN